MDGSNRIVSILETIIPSTNLNSKWANELENEVAKNFKGNNYILRVRMLVSKIKKYGYILLPISPKRLAIMPINYINMYIEHKL